LDSGDNTSSRPSRSIPNRLRMKNSRVKESL
jgi:hypothetical protein